LAGRSQTCERDGLIYPPGKTEAGRLPRRLWVALKVEKTGEADPCSSTLRSRVNGSTAKRREGCRKSDAGWKRKKSIKKEKTEISHYPSGKL